MRLVFTASLLLVCASAWALDPGLPPGGNFDLSHWKLTLPDTNATEISAAQLVAGYTNASWFFTGPDGAMVFWCPVTGGTTSGSSYPRSELREVINPTNDNVNWTGYGTHIMNAQCRVTQAPSTGKTIIGQIHSVTGNAYPLVKLQYNAGKVEALVKESPNSDTDSHFSFLTVGLSNSIVYQIKLENGLLSMTVNGTNQSVNVFQTDPAWTNQTLYFKAGDYCQDNAGPATEGAMVMFYQLSVTHAPFIATQPQPQTVTAGGGVSLAVSALGTAPLTYQWRTNGVNYAKQTNSILSLTNFQSGTEGAYDVVVSDVAGSITSSVATLYLNAPLRFSQPDMTPGGGFNALLLGAAGSNYVLQSSTDLVNWAALSTNVAPGGIISLAVTNALGGNHYYRARTP